MTAENLVILPTGASSISCPSLPNAGAVNHSSALTSPDQAPMPAGTEFAGQARSSIDDDRKLDESRRRNSCCPRKLVPDTLEYFYLAAEPAKQASAVGCCGQPCPRPRRPHSANSAVPDCSRIIRLCSDTKPFHRQDCVSCPRIWNPESNDTSWSTAAQ